MMKKVTICAACLIVFGCVGALAQSNTISSGGEATGSGGSFSYSIGQTDYIVALGSGGNANQGLQQPYEFYTVGTEDNSGIALEMLVFPNPTNSGVKLRIEKKNLEDLSYQLFNMQGQLLVSKRIVQQETLISMQHLSASTYILKVNDATLEIKSFLIVKN